MGREGEKQDTTRKKTSHKHWTNSHRRKTNTTNTTNITQQQTHFSMEDVLALLRNEAPDYMALVDDKYTFDLARTPPDAGQGAAASWSNPLETSLPMAPNMAIACLYGVSKPTERAYVYRQKWQASVEEAGKAKEKGAKERKGKGQRENGEKVEGDTETGDTETGDTKTCHNRRHRSILEIDDTVNAGQFGAGVLCDDGDGTVPLVSLGAVCSSRLFWNGTTKYNPSNIQIRTKEYQDKKWEQLDLGNDPMNAFMQGGPESADHVDILGNHDLIADLLKMVTSKGTAGLPPTTIIHSHLNAIIQEIEANIQR
jgi:phospholipid:diacylglycerol acyltransferase